MIHYLPGKFWFEDIKHLNKSEVLRQILAYVAFTGIYAVIASLLLFNYFWIQSAFSVVLLLPGLLLGAMLSIRLYFSCKRWWQGCNQWSQIAAHSTQLSVILHNTLPKDDEISRAYLATQLVNFSEVLKAGLRNNNSLEGIYLASGEDEFFNQKNNKPAYFLQKISTAIQQVSNSGNIGNETYSTIQNNILALYSCANSCQQLKEIPLPFSLNVFLKLGITVYLFVLPFGLAAEFGIFAVIFVMLASLFLFGMELISEELEDPFGADSNDLPLNKFSAENKTNILQIFGLQAAETTEMPDLYQKLS